MKTNERIAIDRALSALDNADNDLIDDRFELALAELESAWIHLDAAVSIVRRKMENVK